MTDGEQGLLRPGWARPDLVAALSGCVGEWERLLAGPVLSRDGALFSLVQRSQQLEAPSRSVGFGGVGHHLTELSRLAHASADLAPLREQLGVVKELLASARGSLTPEELARPAGVAPGPGAAATGLTPPPLLSGFVQLPPGLGPSGQPPPGMSAPPSPPAALMPPRMLTSMGQVSAPAIVGAPPPLLDSGAVPPASAQRPLPSAPPVAAAPAPAPAAGSASRPAPQHAPVIAAPSRPGQPNLMVRSVLGLRAFGRKEGAPGSGSSAPSAPPPRPPGEPSMLGLQRKSAPPQALGGGYGGLPVLREPSAHGGLPSLPAGLPEPLRAAAAAGADDKRSRQRTPAPLSATPPRGRSKTGGRSRHRGESGEQRWWIGALAALGVCAVVLGIVLVAVMVTRRRDDTAAVAGPAGSGSAAAATEGVRGATGAGSALPRSRLTTDDERFRSLLTQVHGRGKESAELRALLDEQAATAAQALQPGCVGAHCAALAEVGKLVTSSGKKRVKRRSRSPDAMRSRWLAGLEMPEIAVEDDPRVQRRFEFYTENPLGRETFQQMLFRCGAYKDAIQSSLVRRGMPKDLIAVAYAESGCYPLAKSPAGAEGLWQFIPEAARAYHLRIIEGVVDERHSPQKATEAAIQFLSDLYGKFGSWDLVFSAYNMGPFGLAARLERVEGEDVGFWELVDAEMLPGETSEYAPAIQAIALILNNLQRLKFGSIQQRAPQMTMDLPVPPSTRLTMVARAAAMNLDDLRRLNLDIKGALTPGINGFAVQVPKDSVWQARDTLQELVKNKDDMDLCAPQNFDWGRQRFTPEMQEACARTLKARAASSAEPLVAPAPGTGP